MDRTNDTRLRTGYHLYKLLLNTEGVLVMVNSFQPDSNAASNTGQWCKMVEAETGQPISRCFQCKKCSAGCSMNAEMDVKTHRVVRGLLLGQKDKLLQSNSIWVCSGCKTCKQRCPNGIDSGALMDYLRKVRIAEMGAPTEHTNVAAFHDSFLDSVASHGRVYELGMIMKYKFKTGEFTKDMNLGMEMFKRGKLALLPSKISNIGHIHSIFRKGKEGKR